jgi:transcriptional/translational regulatory protein YebC/TACO1
MKLTPKQTEAVLNLRGNVHWQEFLGALGVYAERSMHNLILAPPEKIEVVQGKAQCITEIIKALDEAEKVHQAYLNSDGE